MSPKWLAVAGEMLERASDQFANHGGSDWEWPADWTQAERYAFAEALTRDDVEKPTGSLTEEERVEIRHRVKGPHGPPDWRVMAFLGKQLARDGERVAENPQG